MSHAIVSINRTTSNKRDTDFMTITIEDESSHNRIIQLEMELSDYANLITGLSRQPAKYSYIMDSEDAELIGKERETKTVSIKRTDFKMTPEQVFEGVKDQLVDGWQLFSDGTTSQQPDRDKHNVTLCRYVDVGEKND